jgi:hypothetical protein
MIQRNQEALERRRAALLDELHRLPNLMRGTVYERERKCGRASCRCASGGPRHSGVQLTINIGGKTRTRYVRREERAGLEEMIAAYRRLWELVGELTEVNLALLHAAPARKEVS